MIELLNKYRTIYIQHLRHVIAERCGSAEKSAAELWMELPNAKGIYKNYYRVDAITNDGSTKTYEANIDVPEGTSQDFDYHDTPVCIEPIVWNGVDFECAEVFLEPATIETWFRKWFDEEEQRQPDEHGLSGVIHSVSLGRNSVGVDFGSAPVDALLELLNTLISLGPSRVAIRSRHEEA